MSHPQHACLQIRDLRRTLLPLNDLASWVIVGLSGMICLRILGVDPSPLLALGSVSGIVVGFASQNLLLNLISGISIFLTRPFVVGDIVAVRNGATLVAQGTIANISPLRTTFLDDASRSVTLPNKMLTDMVITNYRKSRLLSSVCCPPHSAHGGVQGTPQPGSASVTCGGALQEKSSKSGTLKVHMDHEFILKAPPGKEGAAYDDVAATVVRALLVRMSVLKDIMPDTPAAHVSGLTSAGHLIIHVSAMGIATDQMSCAAVREKFLLAVHRALTACDAQTV